jgi:acyl-CoA hydrolase
MYSIGHAVSLTAPIKRIGTSTSFRVRVRVRVKVRVRVRVRRLTAMQMYAKP